MRLAYGFCWPGLQRGDAMLQLLDSAEQAALQRGQGVGSSRLYGLCWLGSCAALFRKQDVMESRQFFDLFPGKGSCASILCISPWLDACATCPAFNRFAVLPKKFCNVPDGMAFLHLETLASLSLPCCAGHRRGLALPHIFPVICAEVVRQTYASIQTLASVAYLPHSWGTTQEVDMGNLCGKHRAKRTGRASELRARL